MKYLCDPADLDGARSGASPLAMAKTGPDRSEIRGKGINAGTSLIPIYTDPISASER